MKRRRHSGQDVNSSNPSQSLQGTNDKLGRKYISRPAELHPLPIRQTSYRNCNDSISLIHNRSDKATLCEDALNHNAVANLVSEDKY